MIGSRVRNNTLAYLKKALFAFSFHWVAQHQHIFLCNSLESIPVYLLHNFHWQTYCPRSLFTGFAQNFNISLGCEPELSNQMGRSSALLCNSLESTPVCLLHNFALANVLSAVSLHWFAQNFNISLGCEPELSNQMGRPSALLCNSLESTPVCLLHNFAFANVLSAFSLHWVCAKLQHFTGL